MGSQQNIICVNSTQSYGQQDNYAVLGPTALFLILLYK